MIIFVDFILKGFRKSWIKIFGNPIKGLRKITDAQIASDLIYEKLSSEVPSMIARFGAVEAAFTSNYIGVKLMPHNIIKYLIGLQPQFWWNTMSVNQLKSNAGFYPLNEESICRYGELVIKDSQYIDVLGSWRIEENLILGKHNVDAVQLLLLEPFHCKVPWTRILEGKKVLVIHPFAETIKMQYAKREFLFENQLILPKFELHVIKAVQSIGGNNGFLSWFEALESMKSEMDKINYDIALIGCGAYGIHLAAHAKRQGKKAVHLGGVLQLLFGIKGKRWENPNYGVLSGIKNGLYTNMINEHWVYAVENERPSNFLIVEGGCYW